MNTSCCPRGGVSAKPCDMVGVIDVSVAKLYAVQVRSGAEERTRRLLVRTLEDLVDDCFTPSYETKRAGEGAVAHGAHAAAAGLRVHPDA